VPGFSSNGTGEFRYLESVVSDFCTTFSPSTLQHFSIWRLDERHKTAPVAFAKANSTPVGSGSAPNLGDPTAACAVAGDDGWPFAPISEHNGRLVRNHGSYAGRDGRHPADHCYATNLVDYCIAIENLDLRRPDDDSSIAKKYVT